jgi:hypothetical protein
MTFDGQSIQERISNCEEARKLLKDYIDEVLDRYENVPKFNELLKDLTGLIKDLEHLEQSYKDFDETLQNLNE